jgi:hypothetical protein
LLLPTSAERPGYCFVAVDDIDREEQLMDHQKFSFTQI